MPRLPARLSTGAFVSVLFALVSMPARAADPKVTWNAKVDHLLAQMSLSEKIAMLHGSGEPADTDQGEAGYLAGNKRLGIPAMRFVDGPPGVLTRVPALAPTGTMGVAATFSVEDARLNGQVIAHEAKSHGASVVLQPFINIDRDLAFNRGYNTFGEDPFLTGQIGAAEVKGIQGEGIMSQAKHYIGYDSGNGGKDIDGVVDDQTLHEIYAAPFQMAVDAGVSSIMCSYNQINGPYACGNDKTLNGMLRKEMGFKGFVTSDWGAVHATDFINAGLDLEMSGPLLNGWIAGPDYFAQGPVRLPGDPNRKYKDKGDTRNLPEERPAKDTDAPLTMPQAEAKKPVTNLASLVADGKVSEDTITRAAGRILLQMDRFGCLDGRDTLALGPEDIAADAKIVEKTSVDSAVLLKNDGHVLPLSAADLADTVIIGPNGGQIVAVSNTVEKAVGLPEREIGPRDALMKLSGAKIAYAVANDMDGRVVPAEFLSHAGYDSDHEPGLEHRVRDYPSVTVDATVNFAKAAGTALGPNASAVWTGVLTAPEDGVYRLNLQLLGARGKLVIDDELIGSVWYNWIHGEVVQPGMDNIFPTTDGLDNLRAERKLAKGPHSIRIEIDPDSSNQPAQVRLTWVTPSQHAADYAAAIAAAKTAKRAVVFAWSRSTEPVFRLPGDQDQLIKDIAAVNPNTVVVLNTAQPVATPWLPQVKGLLQMWWTGDEGGWATAKILLGQETPGGRLPFTWPKQLSDMPVEAAGHPERTGEGVDGKTTFSEGLLVGYRWFDRQKIEPQFPFGYGLSYTTFTYSGLSAKPAKDGGLDVKVTVANSGNVAGDEVPQVYLGQPAKLPAGVQYADNALAAFDRIHLDPGQSKEVSLHVPRRSLQYWSTAKSAWLTAGGKRTVWVGASSRDRRLETAVTIGQ